jgi:hypothetical protein
MSSPASFNIYAFLATVATRALFSIRPGTPDYQTVRQALLGIMNDAGDALSTDEWQEVSSLASTARASPKKPPPKRLVELLAQALGTVGLQRWAATQSPSGAPSDPTLAADWLASLTDPQRTEALDAAMRFTAGRDTAADRNLLKSSLEEFLSNKEKTMADPTANYILDPRGVPSTFKEPDFRTALVGILTKSFGLSDPNGADKDTVAEIEGTLILKEYFDPTAFGFSDAIQDAWKYGLGSTKASDGKGGTTDFFNRDAFTKIAGLIQTQPGRGVNIAVQELAYVSQYVIDNATSIDLNSPNIGTQVRIGLDKYVEAAPPSDSLDLPPLTGANNQDVEIDPPNVEAVGVIYFMAMCDRMRLFHVVDRITELYMQGLLPLVFDTAGKALDTYYWNATFRLNDAARNSIYGRVLGQKGADVSKEVTPNKDYDNLLIRFISGLAEYDRQRRLGDIFNNQRPALATTGEQVRKAGRDLAANVSLYGWAGTQAAARRLKDHYITARGLLDFPQIQKAFGVTNVYQVIERVATQEFGASPNIVKYRTMAEAVKTLLNLIAKYANVWSTNTGQSLFPEPDPSQANGFTPADIPASDRDVFLLQATNYLAVNGVGTDQVTKMSEPTDTTYSPSLPAYGAASPTGGGAAGADVMDKLRQMVSSGNAPTLDQIKDMIPAFK